MDETGIEPVTFCLQGRRATNYATRPLLINKFCLPNGKLWGTILRAIGFFFGSTAHIPPRSREKCKWCSGELSHKKHKQQSYEDSINNQMEHFLVKCPVAQALWKKKNIIHPRL